MSGIARRITLWTKKDITKLFKRSQRIYRCEGLDIRVAPAGTSLGRLLIVIPRQSGIAPKRALVRRRLKAIFYEQKLYNKGYDWIFLVKKESLERSFEELKSVMVNLADSLPSIVS
ncbi:MAG TPA: ribonuclease P protein component [Candidatus Babeliaceae bacterium]|nr:ribonuclease P protein component [Candidatus Babeliaceae bacterium]